MPHPLRRLPGILTPVVLAAALPAAALEIELQPGDHVYLNALEGRHRLHDLVLHGIRLHNDGVAPVELEWVEVRATDGATRQVARRLSPLESNDGAAVLAPSGDLLFGALYLASEFAPTEIEVTARYRDGGQSRNATLALPVLAHESEIAYGFPLRGTWYMRGIPSAMSHHRWSQATEFAVDFFKTDAEGKISEGERVDPASYYGYGAEVLAAADGTVEMVIRGMTQDRAARMRREGEPREAYARRMEQLNREAMREHGLGGATGNLVVIRHSNGERTAYGHLKTGSVLVSEGDSVSRGQTIAQVGDTGDSPAVHLHFQVMESEAMRSIPFRFDAVELGSPELGSWAHRRDVSPGEAGR